MARKALSDRALCRYFDVAWYPDDRNPGKFFVATTVGTVADAVNVTIPLADSEEHAIQLAVEKLGLRQLYAEGKCCYA